MNTDRQVISRYLRTLLATATAVFLFVFNTVAQPGALDSSFNPGSSVDFEIFQAAMQSNGKVIIGGAFITPSPGVARLNADGSPDTSFIGGMGVSPYSGYATGVSPVYAIAVQPDRKSVV